MTGPDTPDIAHDEIAPAASARPVRTVLLLAIVGLVFVAAYQLAALARGSGPATGGLAGTPASQAALRPAGGTGSSCACCTNSGTGETIEGSAVVEDDVQRISVDATNGYDPNIIRLAAGIPAEITFSQASGCMAEVMSADLDFFEDLTTGPKTVSLPPLEPGTYGFSCGMEMVFGQIVVE